MSSTSVCVGIHELHRQTLYRVGSAVPLRDLTWAADADGVWEPLNCYVLLAEKDLVFIDTGVRLVEPVVFGALEQFASGRRVSVFPTRNEPDCIGNLGRILGHAEDVALLFGGGGGILEWISDPAHDELDDSSFLGRREIVPALNGTETTIGDALHFHWFDAPVKEMFLTQWAFEERTATLFSSDFFGWVHSTVEEAAPVCSSVSELPSVESIAAELPLRFNWLPGASDCSEVLRAYDEVFRKFDIDRIAPVHGCVIQGADVVAELVRRTRTAIELLIVAEESA